MFLIKSTKNNDNKMNMAYPAFGGTVNNLFPPTFIPAKINTKDLKI